MIKAVIEGGEDLGSGRQRQRELVWSKPLGACSRIVALVVFAGIGETAYTIGPR